LTDSASSLIAGILAESAAVRAELSELNGVVRVTMPLPWALDHVHCYLVRDGDAWTIIDCGLGSRSTLAWWAEALDELDGPPVRRILITHYHPDHLGAAVQLQELTGAPEVVQGRHDAHLSERAWGADADEEEFCRYLELHGMPADMAAASSEAEAATPVTPARPTRLVDEGDEIELGGETFEVFVLPGHADGHIALLGRESRRLFSADVLLEEITPNVGRWPDTQEDPLGAYIRSLGRIDDMRPSRVFPGHGPPIDDAPRRTAEIREHHEERLDAHEAALRAGAESAFHVAKIVWAQDGLGFHEQRFALVEAISHLERLERLGRAVQHAPARWRAA
jgi:glyoxylase-like metal-dependent hydrolase (beta-lactamase superfamily II)